MLTPFAGAGSECVAAKETGREYIGYETDTVYVEIANTRLEHASIETDEVMEETPSSESSSIINEKPKANKRRGKAKATTNTDKEPNVKAKDKEPVEYEQLTFTLDT